MRCMKLFALFAILGLAIGLAATAAAESPKPPYPYDQNWNMTTYTKTTPWTSLALYQGMASYMLTSDVADGPVIISPAFGGRFTVHLNHRVSFPFTFMTHSARVPDANLKDEYESMKFSDVMLQAGARVSYFMHQYCDFGLNVNLGFDIFKETFKSGDLDYKLEGTEPVVGGGLSFMFYPTDYLEFGLTLGANYDVGTRDLDASGADEKIQARSGAMPFLLVSEGFHF